MSHLWIFSTLQALRGRKTSTTQALGRRSRTTQEPLAGDLSLWRWKHNKFISTSSQFLTKLFFSVQYNAGTEEDQHNTGTGKAEQNNKGTTRRGLLSLEVKIQIYFCISTIFLPKFSPRVGFPRLDLQHRKVYWNLTVQSMSNSLRSLDKKKEGSLMEHL